MASFDDLGRALRDDAAANAPRASAIDLDAVTHAARARRRPRQWAVGTLSVVAVLGVGGIAISAVAPPVLIVASESADLETGSGERDTAPLADEGADGAGPAGLVGCGTATTSLPASATDLALELRLELSAPGSDSIDATAVLLNTGATTITVTTGTSVVAVLTQDGVVVGHEPPRGSAVIDRVLAPGQSLELPTLISTLDCRSDAQEALAPGGYGVTAVLDVLDPVTGAATLVIASEVETLLD